jgi:hypothetical protein
MPETRIPGIAAKRVVIEDACREAHGDTGAFNKAALQLLIEYDRLVQLRGEEKGINYHLVLTVEATRGCGTCGNDITVAPKNEDPNPCNGCHPNSPCTGSSHWKPRVLKDPSKTPTELLPPVGRSPGPGLR